MASGPGSGAEEQPPALPVKQHRGRSSRCSSVEQDCVTLSPVELQHPNYACNDVFPDLTDCHAAQCPIHQLYDPCRHQVRFFSDGNPPPVPKKRLARTVSLPSADVPPLSPLSPLRGQPQNFDNPLYMLAPLRHMEEFPPVRGSPGPLLSLSQLSFDTPDEYLPHLFSSFVDQGLVFQRIQHRHLLFLRSMAQSIDAGILLQKEAAGDNVSSYLPQDFLLCEGSEPMQIADTVYYRLHSPKFPGRLLSLKVHKQTDEDPSAHTTHRHVNVRDVIAHFQPHVVRKDTKALLTPDASHPSRPGCAAVQPPEGGSTEHATAHQLLSVQCFLLRGHSVSVERDLPQSTLEDFVQESADGPAYDRQVCVLLLQILMGSQHLCNISGSAVELRPREVCLVWPYRGEEEGRGVRNESRLKEEAAREKTGEGRGIQMLWRTLGSPRVVLTPVSHVLHAPDPLVYVKSQFGALIQYCLRSDESLTPRSSYQRGLLHLASVLQSWGGGLQLGDMLATLQVLLWGPRTLLLDPTYPAAATVHNWLTIKRALLVMKLAERGLIQNPAALDWEDSLCLKYLSFTDSEAVASVISQLGLNVDGL